MESKEQGEASFSAVFPVKETPSAASSTSSASAPPATPSLTHATLVGAEGVPQNGHINMHNDEQVDNVLDRLGVRHVDEEVMASEVIQKAQARWAAVAAAKRARRPQRPLPPLKEPAHALTTSDGGECDTGVLPPSGDGQKKEAGGGLPKEESDGGGTDVEGEEKNLLQKKCNAKRRRRAVSSMLGESNEVRFGDLTPFETQRLAAEQKADRAEGGVAASGSAGVKGTEKGMDRHTIKKKFKKRSLEGVETPSHMVRRKKAEAPEGSQEPGRSKEGDTKHADIKKEGEEKHQGQKEHAMASDAAAFPPAVPPRKVERGEQAVEGVRVKEEEGQRRCPAPDVGGGRRRGSTGLEEMLGSQNSLPCPVCGRHVPVKDTSYPDADLSRHMDRCTRGSRPGKALKGGPGEGGDTIGTGGTGKEGMDFLDDESSGEEQGEEGIKSEGEGQAGASPPLRGQTGGNEWRGKTEEAAAMTGSRRRQGLLMVDDFLEENYRRRLEEYRVGLGALGSPGEATALDGDEDEEEVEDEEAAPASLSGGQAEGEVISPPRPGSRGAQATARREGLGENEVAGPLALPGGFVLPASINRKLYWYQRTGVRWLWELYRQGAGGILGDEMGLGKTVQVSAFLGGLHRSGRLEGGALVVAPATLMSQWVSELFAWAPRLRVVVLHRSAAAFAAQPGPKVSRFVRRVLGMGRGRAGLVCLSTYESLKLLRKELLNHPWAYVALDEGQKIRNPDAEVTICAKQLPTIHRLILSGTPIQNNLRELWSLFDFCFPGRLGTLPAFETELATPIRLGGYSNATPTQAQCAYRCALVLRDLVHPYLLRRMKKDIMTILPLPKKTEQVLFCKLTPRQRALYRAVISSPEIRLIVEGKASHFRAITVLRKICNHADLVAGPDEEGTELMARLVAGGGWADEWRGEEEEEEEEDEAARMVMPAAAREALASVTEGTMGAVCRSGKMQVLAAVLPRWARQGHRVLLFSQTRQMLDLLERFVRSRGWEYLRMDGSTNVGARPALIERFNQDTRVFVFLLTTRTGGLGISLTGANRVILFDPDWNPQTDIQARERAWRLGQRRPVTIYRLVTTGTIEEKIYQRQIFKTAISNRVLVDAKQKRLFSSGELKELFTLREDFAGDEEAPNDTAMEFMDGVVKKADVEGRRRGKKGGKGRKGRREKGRGGGRGEDEDDPVVSVTRGEEVEEERGDGEEEEQDMEDNKILRAVFKGRGLASVLSHDVVEAGRRNTELWMEMQARARQVADRAAAALQASAAMVQATQAQDHFTPTWTGRSGSAGVGGGGGSMPRFGPRRGGLGGGAGGGLASTDILSRFREREGRGEGSEGGLGGADARYVSLLERIKKFLREKGPRVPTEEVLRHFKHVPHSDAVIFKTMLKSVGKLSRGAWTLREEAEREPPRETE